MSCTAGSSPLTRGKPGRLKGGIALCRLIPAHAGKTPTRRCRVRTRRAHPRSRGENPMRFGKTDIITGSSPLTRGKPTDVGRQDQPQGLIPAHAGKTDSRIAASAASRAHPRSRGENNDGVHPRDRARGSSPLTRGKLSPSTGRPSVPGLIPAHAGKTAGMVSLSGWLGAHPRSRGENYVAACGEQRQGGSSPLTRGKHQQIEKRIQDVGLIPAHAGKTRR